MKRRCVLKKCIVGVALSQCCLSSKVHSAVGWSSPSEDVSQFKRAINLLNLTEFELAVTSRKPESAFEVILASSGKQFGIQLFKNGESVEGNACALISKRQGPDMTMASSISGVHEFAAPGAFRAFNAIRKWQPVDGQKKGPAGQDHFRLLFRKKEQGARDKVLIINSPSWREDINNISTLLSNVNFIISSLFGKIFQLPEE